MSSLAEKHILIVEDEPLNATLIIALLKIVGGTHTYVCRTGSEIMAVASTMPCIDLVLLDLQLPAEDGYQIRERLRHEARFQGVPIIALTAQVMPDDVAHAEAVGFDGFLGKPINFDRFPDQIRRLVAGERVWDPR